MSDYFNDGLKLFLFSLGLTLSFQLNYPSDQSENVSVLLPSKIRTVKSGATFNDRVMASIEKCTPYNSAVYSHLDYFGHLHTTIQFFLRNISRVIHHHSLCLPSSFSNIRSVAYNREILTLDDNSTIGIDWAYTR